ncbi:MAG: MFS transporter [Alteromonadaceae bacterium]|jgi:fucose permease|uniref:MFS transporter n=1 Tax=Paraglaciecola chathamensis TaxID=368405 RepID=A0A8H9LZG8_9ALTE|nr:MULTISPECIES: MFS transporter [Paraglaciecola]AEE24725.1 major facilitator superfamily MFS_1 [Glaciecola sp. 4H-3-7+YE-5]MAD16949.1 MFS transporter [Alteromonadaceae bacterium]MBB19340.1 MFS transporter [Rickettsiales bacterium]MBN26924.1 MFS transporter [Alteromonadaceae bacterium]GGZ50001.1 MFS transporter [Paraglaciecola oceanifecundans]|tara:strand:+ start:9370 stop:10656 length:1287 start_codon:yes stop_codon:yes gene_type:complete
MQTDIGAATAMHEKNVHLIRWLTYLMFMMFAMTSDSVGEIIKEVKREFDVSNTQASLMHSLFMIGIAFSGLFLGFLADKFGRKKTIILGLALFALSCYLFLVGSSFEFILGLITLSGLAVGVFKTAALALIGDISRSTKEHTGTMNGAEAFFGVGAIIGPLIVAWMVREGVDWKLLYVLAGGLCTLLILMAWKADYPVQAPPTHGHKPVSFISSLRLLKNPYAMGFSIGAFLYVAAESAIYVWMPSYLVCDAMSVSESFACYTDGPQKMLAMYAVSVFFSLRALGRFVGIWMMQRYNWALVLMLFSLAITLCFIAGLAGGKNVALYAFPLTGVFMSVIYPTFNSKGICCFAKSEHGTVAGVILFFTAAGAAAGPFIMGLVSDAFGGDAKYGFMVATGFSVVLFLGLLYNFVFNPTEKRLREIEAVEYS